MKLLVVTQYFWPEPFIINQVCEELHAQGHAVTVLTGKPNYPDGEIYPGYQSKGLQEELSPYGIPVIRIPLRPRGSGSKIKLALNYFSFIWNGYWFFNKVLKNRDFDIIFFYAPSPIMSALPALRLGRKMKIFTAIWVQDLWPDTLIATNTTKNPLIIGALNLVVRKIYNSANLLLVQSPSFVNSIKIYKIAEKKIIYFPNLYEDFSLTAKLNSLPEKIVKEMNNSFSVVFAGNIGTAQSIETILEAADLLLAYKKIKIFIVGSGSFLSKAQSYKQSHNLENVVFTGRLKIDQIPEVYDNADALLATLKKSDIFSLTIPSKIQSYLCAGKPILCSIAGESARVVSDANAGVVCEPENPNELAASILKLYDMPMPDRLKLGNNGREYYEKNFELKKNIKKLVETLQKAENL